MIAQIKALPPSLIPSEKRRTWGAFQFVDCLRDTVAALRHAYQIGEPLLRLCLGCTPRLDEFVAVPDALFRTAALAELGTKEDRSIAS